MFKFLTRKKPEKYTTWADIPPINALPDPKEYPQMPPVPKPQKQKEPLEFYRVGMTSEGLTTLTLLGEHGTSMTLTMTQQLAMQMIRMIQSTFKEET
jgi:hypothetical protein